LLFLVLAAMATLDRRVDKSTGVRRRRRRRRSQLQDELPEGSITNMPVVEASQPAALPAKS